VLTGVYLRNFQSIQAPVFLKLDKLCFLYGPNSAGKSSILDAIELIRKTVTGETGGYRLSYLYEKERSKKQGFDFGVGIEFLFSKNSTFTSDEISGAKEWWSSPDQSGDYFHQDFFSKIEGKKIQIEFGGEGNIIKVAIEGQPLFEFDHASVHYDDFYKKIQPGEPIPDRVAGSLSVQFKFKAL
jgi:AAA15 family ATPase/GTPase